MKAGIEALAHGDLTFPVKAVTTVDALPRLRVESSTTVHQVTITATDGSVPQSVSGHATLTQTVGPATNVSVGLTPSSIAANGSSTSTATVTDAQDHPIAGDQVRFSSTDRGEVIGSVTDRGDGTYTATITSLTVAGTVAITATDSSVSPSASGYATLTHTVGSATYVSLQLSARSIMANRTSTSVATATVTDVNGNPVPGDSVSFAANDSGVHFDGVTDRGDGTYTATITGSTTVHQVTITATDWSVSQSVSGHATLTQTVGPATNVSVGLAPSSIAANGSSTSTATATVTDAQGHPIAGDHVRFSSTDRGEVIGSVTDRGDGRYTATIKSSTVAGTVTITVTDSSVSPSVTGQQTLTQTTDAPRSISAPAISGKALQGQALIEAQGSWTNNPTADGYWWEDCNSSGNNCSAISGATGQTYTLARL